VKPVLASVLMALSAPEAAMACSVCFSATEQNRMAFLGTTIFLSLLPLFLIGTVSVVLWRRSRALADSASDETP
jgi:hypothetical protein